MNKPPLLPPSGKGAPRLAAGGGKIPGTFSSDPELLNKQILMRAGLRKTSATGSTNSENGSKRGIHQDDYAS